MIGLILAGWLTVGGGAPLRIIGESMEPTLRSGRAYHYTTIDADATVERGDIVVFQFGYRSKRGQHPLVKRVVGVPGDSLGARHGREVPAFETRATVPEGSYYVQGDNPSGRYDSRTFGLISRSQILGKVVPAP